MLPLKINLTEIMRISLRGARLYALVNGKTLTAEQLSLAIGKNRAWMSQIESGRLKAIRREDMISIYKYLYDLNDLDAERQAKKDFSYNLSNEEIHTEIVVITGDTKDESNVDDDLNSKITLKRILELFYGDCFNIFNNSNPEGQKKLLNSLQTLEFNMKKNSEDTLKLISVPVSLLSKVEYENKKDILNDIDNISVKCNRYTGQIKLDQYNDEKNNFLSLVETLNTQTTNIDEKQLANLGFRISTTFLGLTSLLIYGNNDNNLNISMMNDFISLLLQYQRFLPDEYKYYIDYLDPSSDKDALKNKIDEIQNYLCNSSNAPITIKGTISSEIQ